MKKIITVSLLTLGLMLGIFGFQHLSSASGNEGFLFNFIGGSAHTSSKPKQTTSSVYIRATDILGSGGFSAHPSLTSGTRVGPAKVVRLNENVYLTNNAVETYGTGIGVRVDASAHNGPQVASGYWRPDL